MRKPQKIMSAVGLGLGAALLVGAAPAMAQSTDSPESAEAFLESVGYEGVSCLAPTVESDEAIVPAAPSSAPWLIAFLVADVGEETPYADLTTGFVEGDRLSVVNQDLAKQTLNEAVLCSAPTDQPDEAGADVEGNMGARGYSVATNGEPAIRPGFEPNDDTPTDESTDPPSQGPVVETDVPVHGPSDVGLGLGTAGLLTGAGGLLWSRKHRAAQR